MMDDEIHFAVDLPLDDDGFLRRQCPSCENEFKWFSSDEVDGDSATTQQFFCPLCGQAAGVDAWYTDQQAEYIQQVGTPEIDRHIQDMLSDAFAVVKGMSFKANSAYTSQEGVPDALVETNDMTIVEPPCHPGEPVKIPASNLTSIHCLICGSLFSS
jgi:ribosomal protein S27E